MTHIWAHRGARLEATENTLDAFTAAIDAGADGIELDVHPSADGILVVHHDPVLALPDGTTRALADLTAAEITAVPLGESRATIPTLAEVYALVARAGLTLNVELKHGAVRYHGIEHAALDAMRASGMAERVVHSSFDHHALRTLLRLEPEAAIAPLYECALIDPWDYARRLGAHAAHPYAPTLAIPGTLEGFAAAGIAVRAWTVNHPREQRALIEAGIDAIITDDPRAAVALRDSLADA